MVASCVTRTVCAQISRVGRSRFGPIGRVQTKSLSREHSSRLHHQGHVGGDDATFIKPKRRRRSEFFPIPQCCIKKKPIYLTQPDAYSAQAEKICLHQRPEQQTPLPRASFEWTRQAVAVHWCGPTTVRGTFFSTSRQIRTSRLRKMALGPDGISRIAEGAVQEIGRRKPAPRPAAPAETGIKHVSDHAPVVLVCLQEGGELEFFFG